MKRITLGSEGMGSWSEPHTSRFLKVLFPDADTVYENTEECDLIVRSHFFDRRCAVPNGSPYYGGQIEPNWNMQKKPYIYWSGEGWSVKESEYHTRYVHISATNEDPDAIYLPFMVKSFHLNENPRSYTNKNREHLLAYCSSNATEVRENMFNLFVEMTDGDVCHALGRNCGKYKETQRRVGGYWQEDELLRRYSEYNFVFAMENNAMPGYITEKILNVYASGAVPVYWGDSVVSEFFNKDSFIDVSDFDSPEECVEYVVSMEEEKIYWMMEQPIFKESGIYDDIININKNNDYYEKNATKLIPLLEDVGI